jgi:serine/threonine-protein kinase
MEVTAVDPNFSISSRGLEVSSEGPKTRLPEPAEVQAQVQRILESRMFSNCERLIRFVSFAAQHALKGSSEPLKEYVIGLEVFDRTSSYDPRIDPIVRVEARRLRSKLNSYYGSVGREDPILVEFPKGTYTPSFCLRTSRRMLRVIDDPPPHPVMRVLPFASLTTEASSHSFAAGLTEEIVHGLTNLRKLRLTPWNGAGCEPGRLHDRNIDALLRGSVRYESDRVRVIAQCIDARSQAYLWSEAYDRCDRNALWAQDVAQAIVATVALTLTNIGGKACPDRSGEREV